MTDRNEQPAWPEWSGDGRQPKTNFACIRPDGSIVRLFKDVPTLPTPKVVFFTKHFMFVDGWAFPINPNNMPKRRLIMMRDLIFSWSEVVPNPENEKWIDGIVDALHDALFHHD